MSGPAGDSSSVEIVADKARLDDLVGPWRAAAVGLGNAFMTPEWYFSFLEHTPKASPFVLVIEDGGRLSGLVPLVKQGHTVRFAGSEVGDLYQPLPIEGGEERVTDRAVSGLVERGATWRLAVLDKIDPAVAERIRNGLADRQVGGSSHRALLGGRHSLPTIELGAMSWEEYLQDRSHNFRSEIRRKERALARDHEVEFVEVRGGDDLPEALRLHYALHDKRWAGHPRDRSPSWMRPFLTTFAERLSAQGWLRLWRLTVDGAPAASWFGWNIGGRYSYYQAGLDVSRSRLSAGSLLLARTIRASIDEGCSVYDFLLGDESYKQRFTTHEREVTTLVAGKRLEPRLAIVAGGWRLQAEIQRLPPGIKQALRSALRRRPG